MVATIPTWITMIVKQDELDIAPKGGPQHKPQPMNTSEEFLAGPRQVRGRRAGGADRARTKST